MPTNGIAQDARDALIGCLDSGQTGCLVGRTGIESSVRVYVMLGEVLAAQRDEDEAQLLALLRTAGHVDPVKVEALLAALDAGTGLSELLFDSVPEQVLLEALFERFRDNLHAFLTRGSAIEFQPMDAVFVENIQVGHDTRALVDELLALEARIGPLGRQLQLALAPGATPPTSDVDRALVARCTPRIRLSELLVDSPWERCRLLERVAAMLDEGTLVGVVAPARSSAAREDVEPEEDTDDAPTPVYAATEAPVPFVSPFASASVDPSEGEDDLAAFQDYDTVREAGAFLTDRSLLDRVNLDGAEPPAIDASETLLEMEDAEFAGAEALKSAVSLNFSGPKLEEEEIRRKLEVTNDVLATISAAIEAADGRGSGAARVQLLVEGTSVSLAPLFKGVDVAEDGRLPIPQLMKNLRKRPVGEHRRLLNRGLSDLIERALSAADEALDVDGFEAMLEQLAGYQQRLGV